jgi:uncharacterized protein (DUF3820 family)
MSVFAADTWLQLRIRPVEAKLLALALDPAAQGNEIITAVEKLIKSLRGRGVSAADVFHGARPAPTAVDGTVARAYAMRMPFGKHRNRQLADIPLSYLRWVQHNCLNASAGLRHAIAIILEEN